MLRLRIIRIIKTSKYTLGILINIDTDEILCDVLEDPIRDINGDGDLLDVGEKKIYGNTAIPYSLKGKPYKLKVTYSPAFDMDMVLIKNVKHFSGIRFHWGATIKNTEGCPLVGHYNRKTGLMENTGMTTKLVELLQEHDNKGTLEII